MSAETNYGYSPEEHLAKADSMFALFDDLRSGVVAVDAAIEAVEKSQDLRVAGLFLQGYANFIQRTDPQVEDALEKAYTRIVNMSADHLSCYSLENERRHQQMLSPWSDAYALLASPHKREP